MKYIIHLWKLKLYSYLKEFIKINVYKDNYLINKNLSLLITKF